MQSVKRFLVEDEGQDVVEYGLLIATIALIVLVGSTAFGGVVNDWFTNIGAKVDATSS
ncbi:MAG: Flp family type IVb pilin [Chloroflexi bacterium]|nr:Flp family type IVb pilin [Chloroflexota bacterium]